MSQDAKKKLFFIKSPMSNMKAIESFLSKRNYEVFSETDIKESLIRILEIQPDFVFIALDHSSPQIATVPKILAQSVMAHIIPYVQGNGKESLRKLNFSGLPNKLFPPVSGPAIERLVLKLSKEVELTNNAGLQKKNNTGLTESEIIAIRAEALAKLESQKENSANETMASADVHVQKGKRGEFLKTKNQKLEATHQSNLTVEKKESIKTSFASDMKQSLQDMMETYEGFNFKTDSSFKATALSKDSKLSKDRQSFSPMQGLQTTGDKTNDSDIATESRSEGVGAEMDVASGASQLNQANASIHDLIDEKAQLSATTNGERISGQNSAYCMTIQSSNWCGYLLLYSDIAIDFSTSHQLFKDWLSKHFENLMDFEDTEHFEIQVNHPNYKDWAKEKADHFETVTKNENEIVLSFFSIDPRSLMVEMNENELIEVPLKYVPLDKELALSLYLHLPENKKYLLYTPIKQKLNVAQRKRLTDKNIQKLYTQAEYEKEFRKLVAETYLNDLLENIKKENP